MTGTAVVVGVLLIFSLIAVLLGVFGVARRVWRWADESRPSPLRPGGYGALPTLAEPVGSLGSPAPDADLSSTAGDPDDVYGD